MLHRGAGARRVAPSDVAGVAARGRTRKFEQEMGRAGSQLITLEGRPSLELPGPANAGETASGTRTSLPQSSSRWLQLSSTRRDGRVALDPRCPLPASGDDQTTNSVNSNRNVHAGSGTPHGRLSLTSTQPHASDRVSSSGCVARASAYTVTCRWPRSPLRPGGSDSSAGERAHPRRGPEPSATTEASLTRLPTLTPHCWLIP